jgi:ribosome-binding factor A
MFPRIIQLNELFKREVSKILLKENVFGRDILVTVTRAEITPDLGEAKIFISVLPEDRQGEVLTVLKKGIYPTQQQINKSLHLKKVPKIIFCTEKKVKEAGRVEELLEEIRDKDK